MELRLFLCYSLFIMKHTTNKHTLASRRYREKYPEKYKALSKKWAEATKESHKRDHQQRRQRLYDYLKIHPCVDCGEDDWMVLEFDHIRGVKSFNVMSSVSRTKELIEAEIAKCDIRCANCHRRRHAKERESLV